MSAPAVPVPGAPPAAPAAERRRGYGRWKGARESQAWRWWVIARGNLSVSLASRWVKVVLVASLVPGIVLAGVTYFILPLSRATIAVAMGFETIFVFLVATLVGARLVSEDRRQGAFLVHFSRPVRRRDYIGGKVAAIAIPLLFVTFVPLMIPVLVEATTSAETVAERAAREAGVSYERSIVQAGGDTSLRPVSPAAAAFALAQWSLIASLGTAGIVLGLSALALRARTAGLIWFAVVALGGAAHGILGGALRKEWPAGLSWVDNVTDLGMRLLGIAHNPDAGYELEMDPLARLAILLVAGLVGLAVVHEQIRRSEGGERG
ncbi:MAG TPA: hypothetical protein VHH36_01895 [Candidatus Thermoplasmatota archaeon]|nr:hypothetical protein [Candidatus Thermoplasmatota archaeon]